MSARGRRRQQEERDEAWEREMERRGRTDAEVAVERFRRARWRPAAARAAVPSPSWVVRAVFHRRPPPSPCPPRLCSSSALLATWDPADPSEKKIFVKSIIREVAGFSPYEKRVMELLRNSKDKKAKKLTKKRVSTPSEDAENAY